MRARILIAAAAAVAALATGAAAARADACPTPVAPLHPLVLFGPAADGTLGYGDGDLLESPPPSAPTEYVDGPVTD